MEMDDSVSGTDRLRPVNKFYITLLEFFVRDMIVFLLIITTLHTQSSFYEDSKFEIPLI